MSNLASLNPEPVNNHPDRTEWRRTGMRKSGVQAFAIGVASLTPGVMFLITAEAPHAFGAWMFGWLALVAVVSSFFIAQYIRFQKAHPWSQTGQVALGSDARPHTASDHAGQ